MPTTDTAPRPEEKELCLFRGGRVDLPMGHRPALAAALLLLAACHRTPLGFIGYLGDAGAAAVAHDAAPSVTPDLAADPSTPPDLAPPPDTGEDLPVPADAAPSSPPPVMPTPD